MFLLMVAFLAATEVQPLWEITETENYSPFLIQEKGNIAVTDDGVIFVLEQTSTRMTRYDASGKNTGVVAIMGDGPGELANPLNVSFHNGRIYVLEMMKRSIHVYKTDGSHDRDINFPAPPFMRAISPTSSGWAIADWEFAPNGKPIEVIHYNTNLTQPKTLASWPRKQNDGSNIVFIDKTRVAGYNPAKSRHFMVSSQDGKRLYVAIPGQRVKFNIYDTENNKLLKTITKKDWLPLPFNTIWGDKRLVEYKDIALKPGERGAGLRRVDADYPEYFPVVRYLFQAADGAIVAVRWTGRPNTSFNLAVMDADLNETKTKFSDEALLRMLHIKGDVAYVTTFNAEYGSAGVAACRLSDVNAYVKAHPGMVVEPVSTGILMPTR